MTFRDGIRLLRQRWHGVMEARPLVGYVFARRFEVAYRITRTRFFGGNRLLGCWPRRQRIGADLESNGQTRPGWRTGGPWEIVWGLWHDPILGVWQKPESFLRRATMKIFTNPSAAEL
jgi:hypothetical protein